MASLALETTQCPALTRGCCPAWVLPALTAVPISVLMGLCYASTAKGLEVTWGGSTRFIAVQALAKPGEFPQCESGIHHRSGSACSSRTGIASAGMATGEERRPWRCWMEAVPGGLQTERAGLMLLLISSALSLLSQVLQTSKDGNPYPSGEPSHCCTLVLPTARRSR